MGAQFSQQEYKERLTKFSEDFLALEHNADLDKFLQASDDFANVFTTVSLDDFRSIKECKTDNIVHLVSHVSPLFESFNHIFYSNRLSKSCMMGLLRTRCYRRRRTSLRLRVLFMSLIEFSLFFLKKKSYLSDACGGNKHFLIHK